MQVEKHLLMLRGSNMLLEKVSLLLLQRRRMAGPMKVLLVLSLSHLFTFLNSLWPKYFVIPGWEVSKPETDD
jgi:hypothetical protein